MTKVEEIEGAVQSLTREEFRLLFAWMANKDNEVWDQQFEKDVNSGKLDAMGEAALSEYNAGNCRAI